MENVYQNHSKHEPQQNPSPTQQSHFSNPIHDHEKNHVLPFSILVNIPKGFHIQKQTDPKLVYDLSYLSMTKEICKKSIEVDHCGCVDVDLHVLKIKGCLSFLLNLCIEPIHKQKICSTDAKDDSIFLCCQDTLYVDHILKYSVGKLPYYVIDEDHIQVRKLEIQVLDDSPQVAKISGIFYFEYE